MTTSNMKHYRLTPLAPLVIGNGKPFGAGERNGGLEPHPGVVAGAMRAHWVDQEDRAIDRQTRINNAQQQTCRGPFLLHENAKELTLYVPQPADSVYLQDQTSKQIHAYRLAPQALPNDVGGNWPSPLPVFLQDSSAKGKPAPGPRYWPLKDLLQWRSNQDERLRLAGQDQAATLPLPEVRTHVAIDMQTRTASDGQLFQTVGLDYGPGRNQARQFSNSRWHLAAGFAPTDDAHSLEQGLVTIGGERRPTWLSPEDPALTQALAIPSDWLTTASHQTHWLCLTLLTPALFDAGWIHPALLGEKFDHLPGHEACELKVKLVAAAMPRWQGISGWDLANRKPKASRRMVPAGAVYWLELEQNIEPHQFKALWLAAISSQEQDRKDGFGAVIPALVKKTQSSLPNI